MTAGAEKPDLAADHLNRHPEPTGERPVDPAENVGKEPARKPGRPAGSRDKRPRRKKKGSRTRRAAPVGPETDRETEIQQAEDDAADQRAMEAAEEIVDSLGAVAVWFGGPDAAYQPVGPLSRQYAIERAWFPVCRKYGWKTLPPELGLVMWSLTFAAYVSRTPVAQERIAAIKERIRRGKNDGDETTGNDAGAAGAYGAARAEHGTRQDVPPDSEEE